MPKFKTHSGAKKRFNLTKSGKVEKSPRLQEPYPHQEDHQAHQKSPEEGYADITNSAAIREMIPYK